MSKSPSSKLTESKILRIPLQNLTNTTVEKRKAEINRKDDPKKPKLHDAPNNNLVCTTESLGPTESLPPLSPSTNNNNSHKRKPSQEANITTEAILSEFGASSHPDHLRQCYANFVTSPDVQEDEYLPIYMKHKEKDYLPKSYYLKWHPDLSPVMRAILLDWMNEVAVDYQLNRETYHMAVNFVDRFQSAIPNVPRTRFQLVGVTALFIASKVEEIENIQPKELVIACDCAYSVEQLFSMERIMVQKLEWNLLPVTVVSWVKTYLARLVKLQNNNNNCNPEQSFPKKDYFKCMQWIDYCILDIASLQFPPSKLAASVFHCVYNNDKLLDTVTGYRPEDIAECKTWLEPFGAISPGKPYSMPLEFLSGDFHDKQFRHPDALAFLKQKLKAPNGDESAQYE